MLRTTHNDEVSLKDCLKRVSIGLEAHAVSSSNANDPSRDRLPPGSQARDVVWTGKVDMTEDPITMVVGSAEESQTVLLVWRTTASLGRPRVRLQAPSIFLKVSASLQPALREKIQGTDPYLPSGIPLSTNILQPVGNDAALGIVLPQFSSLRLNRKISGDGGVALDRLPLKVIPRRPCRAIPALSSRIRVQKSPFNTGIPNMIGALEIDVPPFAQHPLRIVGIKVTLPRGTVNELSGGKIPKFPLTVKARDQVVCLYSLSQDVQATAQGQGVQTLEVLISVSIMVSDDCHPQVRVRFKANVDFLGGVELSTQKQSLTMQRSNKPARLNESSVKPSDLPMEISPENLISASKERIGIVLKFTANGTVYVGEPFQWEVFVVNRSKKHRRIGLSMLHKRLNVEENRSLSRSTNVQGEYQQENEPLAKAFTEDNLLYTMMKSHKRDRAQLLCLNTDVKIGYVHFVQLNLLRLIQTTESWLLFLDPNGFFTSCQGLPTH